MQVSTGACNMSSTAAYLDLEVPAATVQFSQSAQTSLYDLHDAPLQWRRLLYRAKANHVISSFLYIFLGCGRFPA